MSIVTDALNRLQSARASRAQPLPAHDPVLSKADMPDSNEDEKKPTVDKTFVSVSIAGFLLALVVAIGAYWWGEYPTSDIKSMTSSVSTGPDRSIDLSRDNSVEPMPSEQDATLPAEPLVELLPGELPPLSPSYDEEDSLEVADPLEDGDREITVSVSTEVMAEPLPDSESQVSDGVGLSVTPDSVATGEDREQEFQEDLSNGAGEARGLTENESRADMGLHSPDKDASPQVLSPLSERSEHSLQSEDRSEAFHEARDQRMDEKNVQSVSSADATSSLPSPNAEAQHLVQHDESAHEPMRTETRETSITEVSTRLSPKQRIVKARLLIQQQSHAEAIAVLQPLFILPPATWEPWFWMGTAQFGLGELDKAEDAFMEGLVRDDTVPYLWVQRAVIEQQRGQYGKAMDALRQAELLDPKLPEVQLNLAYNLEQQGQVNLARRHYRQYLTLTEGRSAYHGVRRKVLEHMLRTQPSPIR
ncbi:tetratricopeptide repeat protein [Nitrospira sp. M1]